MIKITSEAIRPDLAERLGREFDEMAGAQFETPELRLLFSTPLTLARARFAALQKLPYTLNRRDCWAYVQARSPWEIKQIIWKHEEDELILDNRGGADHRALLVREAKALGLTEKDFDSFEPPPLVVAPLYAWLHIAATLPWLGVLSAFHILERRNSGAVVKNGGISKRWRDKLETELKIPRELLTSSNVHIEADVDHADSTWQGISRYITDEHSYKTAIEGARESLSIDRAYRAALAFHMRSIDQ